METMMKLNLSVFPKHVEWIPCCEQQELKMTDQKVANCYMLHIYIILGYLSVV